MSKKYYPVINYDTCTECGACVEKCSNGVYESNTLKPKVVNPDGCTDGCHGCQNLCPTDSIEYVGDVGQESSCGCNCTCQL